MRKKHNNQIGLFEQQPRSFEEFPEEIRDRLVVLLSACLVDEVSDLPNIDNLIVDENEN